MFPLIAARKEKQQDENTLFAHILKKQKSKHCLTKRNIENNKKQLIDSVVNVFFLKCVVLFSGIILPELGCRGPRKTL